MPLNLAKFRLPQNHLWCTFQSLWGGMLYEMSRIEKTTTRLPLYGLVKATCLFELIGVDNLTQNCLIEDLKK